MICLCLISTLPHCFLLFFHFKHAPFKSHLNFLIRTFSVKLANYSFQLNRVRVWLPWCCISSCGNPAGALYMTTRGRLTNEGGLFLLHQAYLSNIKLLLIINFFFVFSCNLSFHITATCCRPMDTHNKI